VQPFTRAPLNWLSMVTAGAGSAKVHSRRSCSTAFISGPAACVVAAAGAIGGATSAARASGANARIAARARSVDGIRMARI